MDALDTAINWLSNQFTAIDDSVESWSEEWQTKVDALKVKAKEFTKTFDALSARKDIAARDEKVSAEYDALMTKGEWLKSSISFITNKIDSVYNSFFRGSTPSGMGIAPLAAVVPVVAITGSIAAMTAWLSDAYILNRKLNHIESQIEGGATSDEARAGVEATYNKGSLINLEGSPVMGALFLAGIGVAFYLLLPKLKATL